MSGLVLSLVNEHGQTVSLWQDFISVATDPAHILTELTFFIVTTLLEILVIQVLWRKWLKPRIISAAHQELDAEHGIEHHKETDRMSP